MTGSIMEPVLISVLNLKTRAARRKVEDCWLEGFILDLHQNQLWSLFAIADLRFPW